MKKQNIFSIPNFILIIILGLALFKATFYKSTKIISSDSYNDWYYSLFCVQNIEVTKLLADQVQCSDIANFASGIVFGLGKFTSEFKTEYKSLGLIHLIVASGTQVNYLFSAVDKLLIKLGIFKKIRYLFFLISCFTLFMLIGFTPPLIRASIFIGIIVTLTTFFGRFIHPLRALIFTLSIILIFNPQWLYSFSLWLSVLASFAIIVSAEFENSFILKPLQDNLFVTILLLPILSQFNTSLNLITIPLNIILAIILPYLIGLLLFCFIPIVGYVFKIISVFTLTLTIGIISSISDLTAQYSTIKIIKLNLQDMIAYYVFLILILLILYTYKINKFNYQAIGISRLVQ